MDTKPIPAFYCCYLLRSTVQRGFNYIGSTPNMLRRIRQHNGESTGGAKRTSWKTLKPWEVTCIVHGFSSKIAALQFEWAWQHTYKSRHAKNDNEGLLENLDFRVSPKSGKLRKRKATAHARGLTDRITNLHILLRSRSFSGWPLSVRFFCADVYRVWSTVNDKFDTTLRDTIDITLDPNAVDHYAKPESAATGLDAQQKLVLNGVENLDFGYSNMKSHVEKSKLLLTRDDIKCAVCAERLRSDDSLQLVCEHDGCEAVSHLQCLSGHFLAEDVDQGRGLVPITGSCPQCSKPSKWQTLTKELTLRTRGEKELAVLFKKPRVKKNGTVIGAAVVDDEFKTIEELEEDQDDSFRDLEEFEADVIKEALEDNLPAALEGESSLRDKSRKPTESTRTTAKTASSPPKRRRGRPRKNSSGDEAGWSAAEVLD